MPELPEVETTRRGVEPHCCGQTITGVQVREFRLRWPVPEDLSLHLRGQTIQAVQRRGKYLLFELSTGTLIVHLGMTGTLRLVGADCPVARHDHVDIHLGSGMIMRYTDPRRFGAVLWHRGAIEDHVLIRDLGPEPLEPGFDGALLFRRAAGRSAPIKAFIMDSHVVVGVGNIYANEALFMAGVHPRRAAGRISRARYDRLARAIVDVLGDAIEQGGTTLRDFVGGDGKPGYFKQELKVYGRAGLPCVSCQKTLVEIRMSGRSTVFCPDCQR